MAAFSYPKKVELIAEKAPGITTATVQKWSGREIIIQFKLPPECVKIAKPMLLTWKTEKGIYKVATIVKNFEIDPSSGIITARLVATHDVERIQRREHARVDVLISAKYYLLDENDEVKAEATGMIINLGAGGFAMATDLPMQIGDMIMISFRLPGGEMVSNVFAELVRKIDIESITGYKYGYGFKFIVISEAEREAISKFVIRRQQELRQKGVL